MAAPPSAAASSWRRRGGCGHGLARPGPGAPGGSAVRGRSGSASAPGCGSTKEQGCRCQPRSVRGAQGSYGLASVHWTLERPPPSDSNPDSFSPRNSGSAGEATGSHWHLWMLCKGLRGVQCRAQPGGSRERAVSHRGRSGQEQGREREQMCHGESHAFPLPGL